jgi:phosphatidylserine/phosphatidylglycerophosphate/cardiolipin synthase-like enzyme
MRVVVEGTDFRVKAIAGTHTVLMALDSDEPKRHGLLGFAFKRDTAGATNGGPKWLRSLKVFKSVVPDPLKERDPADPSKPKRFSSWEHPVQSFLWSDYTAQPDTEYTFTIVPMYGRPGALKPAPGLSFTIRTEKEFDQGHGVWFNRGAIAGQAFAREFGNSGPEPRDNPDPKDKRTRWLSRGLLEACLKFIDGTRAGDGLRVAAYEFTYEPVAKALKKALDRGVDVRIVYHGTLHDDGHDGANEKTIGSVGLPKHLDSRQVLYPRTKTTIPHNKFIIRLKGGTKPVQVWTGSTNFTPSGFLGQTNVGHLIKDATTAERYLDYWEILKDDPDLETARAAVMEMTPHPASVVAEGSITPLFSPRPKSKMLDWYADRIDDAAGSVMFTAAFGVAKQLVPSIAQDRDFLRFLLMEKPPTTALKEQFDKDRDLVISYGDVLGEMYVFKKGKPVARKKIQEFDLDKWYLEEEHYRRTNEGFVFFVHTKFLLIDPLSDDPLVCSGSANFSSNSLLQNDENMLLIRGDTRVADIYLTEFDRIFRHFYFRNVANEIEAKGGDAEGAFLDETSDWTDGYFKPGRLKTRRREMFFAEPTAGWAANAAARGVP